MPATKHTYLKTHTLSSAVLSFELADEYTALHQRAAASKSRRAAKTLVKEGRMRVTVIAMQKGARLSAHQVEGVVSLQALRGRLRVAAEGETIDLSPTGLLVLQDEVPHTAEALTDCALLVTVAMSTNGR